MFGEGFFVERAIVWKDTCFGESFFALTFLPGIVVGRKEETGNGFGGCVCGLVVGFVMWCMCVCLFAWSRVLTKDKWVENLFLSLSLMFSQCLEKKSHRGSPESTSQVPFAFVSFYLVDRSYTKMWDGHLQVNILWLLSQLLTTFFEKQL